jgi:hypothetical protein
MNDNTAKLVWTGYAPWYGNRMVFNYNNTSNIWSSSILNAGSNVLQSHVNNTDDGNFVIGWAQNNLPLTNNMIKGNYLYHIYTLPTTGNNIQMNNASSWGTMYAMAISNDVYCLISDGECSEGSIWEALAIREKYKVFNLRVYVNANGFGAYDPIDLDFLEKRLSVFTDILFVRTRTFIKNNPYLKNVDPEGKLLGQEGHYVIL